jgi:hypothetical protein
MRQPPKAISGVVLLWVLAIAGCGSSGSSTAKSVPKIALKSPAIVGASIPARYTCDGKDISPPLEWGAVPADTSSLVLLVVGLIPEAATKTYKLSVEWAAAGLNPALHRLASSNCMAYPRRYPSPRASEASGSTSRSPVMQLP